MAPDGDDSATWHLDLSITKGPPGQVQVILQGPSEGEESGHRTITSSRVTLMAPTLQHLYAGSLTTIDGEKQWHMTALLTGIGTQNASELQIQLDVHVDAAGRAAGTLSANPAGGSKPRQSFGHSRVQESWQKVRSGLEVLSAVDASSLI
jgi:hypothetical protein